ncbi:MAG: hypothetical protein AAEJ46_05825, partial [Planctomycetota bacterium]
IAAINGWSVSLGSDVPEGQLYALDQLVKDAAVNWRAGSVRIIVYFGDAPGHDPVCSAMSGLLYDITEASLIADLQGAGDFGTTIIAVSSGTGLNNAFNSIDYASTCGASSGPSGQADRITAATGGLVEVIGNSSQVTDAILDAIDIVLAQPLVLPVGSADPNVMQVPLPDPSAYGTLSTGGGTAPLRISPNVAWISSLSANAGWIHSNHNGSTGPGGSGSLPSSVLYAHEFTLPSIPTNATVVFDLEWAADETLFGVSMNNDVGSLGGALGIGGTLNPEFSFASTGQVVGTALSLNLMQGSNRLYLSTLENFPGGTTVDNPFIVSGIMYIAKMTIAFNCCDHHGGDELYETVCECIGEGVAPCNNDGGPEQGCENSSGAGSSLTASGLNPAVTLHADNLPLPQTIGLFFRGVNQVGPLPFGDGIRCVGGEIERLEVVITSTGEATHGPFFSPPGAFYQFWYRDVLGPCGYGFNLSSAILIP